MTEIHVRYSFNWSIMNNGDCNAEVTRYVKDSVEEETSLQITVTKSTIRLYPSEGQTSFKTIPECEHAELLTASKAFYAGVNNKHEFFYWTNNKKHNIVNPFLHYVNMSTVS